MATSVSAAISAMNGAPLAGKPLRQNLMLVTPWSRRRTSASASSTTSENSLPLSRSPTRSPLSDCGRSAVLMGAVAGAPVGSITVWVLGMAFSLVNEKSIPWYNIVYNRPSSAFAVASGRSGAPLAAQLAGQFRDRLEALDALQALRGHVHGRRVEAQAGAILEFHAELRG